MQLAALEFGLSVGLCCLCLYYLVPDPSLGLDLDQCLDFVQEYVANVVAIAIVLFPLRFPLSILPVVARVLVSVALG